MYDAMLANKSWQLQVGSVIFMFSLEYKTLGASLPLVLAIQALIEIGGNLELKWKYQPCVASGERSSGSWGRELQVLGLDSHFWVAKEEHHWIVAMDHMCWGSWFGSSSHSGSKLWISKGAVHSTAMIFTAILWTLMMVRLMVSDDSSFSLLNK